jgi:hypothetical protein
MDALLGPRHRTVAPRGLAHLGAIGDAWFQALDQSLQAVGPRTLAVQVLGVHVGDDRLWLQIAAANDPFVSFVVCVHATTTLSQVQAALRALPSVPHPFEVIRVGADPLLRG